MGGIGAGLALLERMICAARANRFKILPICPHSLTQYKKHPEWSDVMTGAPSAD